MYTIRTLTNTSTTRALAVSSIRYHRTTVARRIKYYNWYGPSPLLSSLGEFFLLFVYLFSSLAGMRNATVYSMPKKTNSPGKNGLWRKSYSSAISRYRWILSRSDGMKTPLPVIDSGTGLYRRRHADVLLRDAAHSWKKGSGRWKVATWIIIVIQWNYKNYYICITLRGM